jgi:hypothetical protein
MTSRGRRIAFLLGVLVALALPRRIEEPAVGRCTSYVVEPWGIYLLDHVVSVELPYKSGQDCR